MNRGDFIITPRWTWHDHGHEGDEPVVWLDGLDVPLVSFLRAGFRENHEARAQVLQRIEGESTARFGAGMLPLDHDRKAGMTSPVFSYPYERSREALHVLSLAGDGDPHLGLCLKYVNPVNGDWAMPTLGTTLRYFPLGFQTRAYRSTESLVLVGMEGRADILLQDSSRLSIGANDIVAIPAWTAWSVHAQEDTVLFSYSDRPVHEKLGLLREQRS
jgi:gentisate 1,2-dioxygenase